MEWVWILLVIIFLLGVLKYLVLPILKGKFGEALVKLMIGKEKEGVQYVINNVTISVGGKSSQIDHVVVNDRGITCIETKNYSGRIYGEENQQQWTQVLAYGKSKHRLYNPLKQNWTHVKRLEEVLGKDYPFHSLVVFVQSNTRYINARNVTGLWGIRRELNSVGNAGAMSPDEIRNAASEIRALKEANIVSASEHIQEIRQMKEDIANNICPRCGGKLILRHGKHGDFYGCEKYPECKFTKSV